MRNTTNNSPYLFSQIEQVAKMFLLGLFGLRRVSVHAGVLKGICESTSLLPNFALPLWRKFSGFSQSTDTSTL